MEQQLQNKLAEILTSIQTATGRASDFTIAQLPDIAQSYVMYGRVVNLVGVAAGIALALCAVFLWRRLMKENKKPYQDRNEALQFLCIAGGVAASIASPIFFGICLADSLLAWLAPKVWLLQQLAEMVRNLK